MTDQVEMESSAGAVGIRVDLRAVRSETLLTPVRSVRQSIRTHGRAAVRQAAAAPLRP